MPSFLRPLLIALLVLLPAAAAATAPPPVRYEMMTPAGRAAAERCHEIWLSEGAALAADLLPAGTVLDTVLCLVLETTEFQRYFGGGLPDWGVGAAVPGGRVVGLDPSRLPAVGRGLREVFLHEMAHALLFQGAGEAVLPAWFHEGCAMLYSGEWRFRDTVSLALEGRVPELGRLQGRFPATAARADRAYRTSLLAVTRLRDRHGPAVVGDLVAAAARSGSFETAFLEVTGETAEDFAADFAGAMRLRFGWLVILTRWPSLFVLMALILMVGALRKIFLARRRLAQMADEEGEA